MRPGRSLVAALWVVYLAVVAVLVFQPDAEMASDSVSWADEIVRGLGAPSQLGPAVIEFVANIVLFVPLSLLGSWLFTRRTWLSWTFIGLGASVGIELTQLLFLPGRSGTVSDLVANTAGALIGAVGYQLLLGVTSAMAR